MKNINLWLLLGVSIVLWACATEPGGQTVLPRPEEALPKQEAAVDDDETEFAAEPVAPENLPSDALQEIRRRGEIRIALPSSIGGTMRNKEGRLIGFEVDVVRKLADDIGVRVRFYPVPWPDLLEPLLDGRVDLAAGGIWVTPEKALVVNFSQPYRSGGLSLLARRTKTSLKRAKIEDFNRKELRIGFVPRADTENILSKRLPDTSRQSFQNDAEMFTALRAGAIDAAAVFSSRAALEALQYPNDFVPPVEPLSSWPQAFALRKNDFNFINFLNSWILIYTQEGWIAERYNYWFKNISWAEEL